MSVLAQVKESHRGEHAIAHIEGEIDASNIAWVEGRLRALLTNRSEALTVDLSETTYIDSTGIALLFRLASSLSEHQQRLQIVVRDPSPIKRMVTLTGLDRTVTAYTDLDAALAEG